MQIWPAIDLRGGMCVRLRQGDYNQETVFGEDPAAMARHWVAQGAECLHLVDLDGARDGKPTNLPSVERILQAVNVPCQLGGGIRDEERIAQLVALGVSRLVVGTKALREPDWFRAMCRKYPDRLVLGLDAREGRVAMDGWLETSEARVEDVARQFADEPLAAIVMTDIARDGMLEGPNVLAYRQLRAAVNVPLVASGGVTRAEDIRQLAEIPVEGCIVGRALYEGFLGLAEAIAAAGGLSAA